MNKTGVINALTDKTGYDREACIIAVDIFERDPLIGKRSRNKAIENIILEAGVTREESERLVDEFRYIMKNAIKAKLKKLLGWRK